MDVGLDRPHRAVHDQLHADRRGKVVDVIGLVHELGHEPAVVAGVDRVAEARFVPKVPDVLDRAGREVIQNVNAMPQHEEVFGEMGANEARATSDQYPHWTSWTNSEPAPW